MKENDIQTPLLGENVTIAVEAVIMPGIVLKREEDQIQEIQEEDIIAEEDIEADLEVIIIEEDIHGLEVLDLEVIEKEVIEDLEDIEVKVEVEVEEVEIVVYLEEVEIVKEVEILEINLVEVIVLIEVIILIEVKARNSFFLDFFWTLKNSKWEFSFGIIYFLFYIFS